MKKIILSLAVLVSTNAFAGITLSDVKLAYTPLEKPNYYLIFIFMAESHIVSLGDACEGVAVSKDTLYCLNTRSYTALGKVGKKIGLDNVREVEVLDIEWNENVSLKESPHRTLGHRVVYELTVNEE